MSCHPEKPSLSEQIEYMTLAAEDEFDDIADTFEVKFSARAAGPPLSSVASGIYKMCPSDLDVVAYRARLNNDLAIHVRSRPLILPSPAHHPHLEGRDIKEAILAIDQTGLQPKKTIDLFHGWPQMIHEQLPSTLNHIKPLKSAFKLLCPPTWELETWRGIRYAVEVRLAEVSASPPLRLWLHRADGIHSLLFERLSLELQDYYTNGRGSKRKFLVPVSRLGKGAMVVAQFGDSFNRAVVEKLEGPHALVRCVDYGCEAWTPADSLRYLQTRLYFLAPAQAIPIRLPGLTVLKPQHHHHLHGAIKMEMSGSAGAAPSLLLLRSVEASRDKEWEGTGFEGELLLPDHKGTHKDDASVPKAHNPAYRHLGKVLRDVRMVFVFKDQNEMWISQAGYVELEEEVETSIVCLSAHNQVKRVLKRCHVE